MTPAFWLRRLSLAGLAMSLCGKETQTAPKEKTSRWSAIFSRR